MLTVSRMFFSTGPTGITSVSNTRFDPSWSYETNQPFCTPIIGTMIGEGGDEVDGYGAQTQTMSVVAIGRTVGKFVEGIWLQPRFRPKVTFSRMEVLTLESRREFVKTCG